MDAEMLHRAHLILIDVETHAFGEGELADKRAIGFLFRLIWQRVENEIPLPDEDIYDIRARLMELNKRMKEEILRDFTDARNHAARDASPTAGPEAQLYDLLHRHSPSVFPPLSTFGLAAHAGGGAQAPAAHAEVRPQTHNARASADAQNQDGQSLSRAVSHTGVTSALIAIPDYPTSSNGRTQEQGPPRTLYGAAAELGMSISRTLHAQRPPRFLSEIATQRDPRTLDVPNPPRTLSTFAAFSARSRARSRTARPPAAEGSDPDIRTHLAPAMADPDRPQSR